MWLDEVRKRIAINEGVRQRAYRDTRGILTIGTGFNLERGDAKQALARSGVTDIEGVLSGITALTVDQVTALFNYSFAGIVAQSRASLAPSVFDSMTDARRFVVCDLNFQLGQDGWLDFVKSRSLLNTAQIAKNQGNEGTAHVVFSEAADELTNSDWFAQSGDRSKRNVAMIKWGEFVDPYGDGSH